MRTLGTLVDKSLIKNVLMRMFRSFKEKGEFPHEYFIMGITVTTKQSETTEYTKAKYC